VTRAAWFALLAGAVPVLAVNLAFWLNVQAGLPGCFPYLDGCYSVSRGVRDGPGLWVFKSAALPTVLFMVLTWRTLPDDLAGKWARYLATFGAVALLFYAVGLGTEGEFYKWMRRYGIVFFFGFTGIAQLHVANRLWRQRGDTVDAGISWPNRLYLLLAVVTWAVGLLTAFKRQLFDDPLLIDRIENAAEWCFALGLGLLFMGLALVLVRRQYTDP
jgi:hypothetical protein